MTFSYGPIHMDEPVLDNQETYLQQFCTDRRCSLEDLPGAMDDEDDWQETVREIHAQLDDDDDDLWFWYKLTYNKKLVELSLFIYRWYSLSCSYLCIFKI